MINKITLLTVFALALTFSANAQKSKSPVDGTIEGEVIETDPDNLPNFSAGWELMGFDIGSAFVIGGGLDANYRLNNWSFKANTFMPYVDSERRSVAVDDNFKQINYLRYNRTEVGATYYFAKKDKILKDAKMHLRSETIDFNTTLLSYLRTDIPFVKSYGVRFGFNYRQQTLAAISDISVKDSALHSDGNYYNLTPASMTVSSVYIGLCRTKSYNYVFKSKKFNKSYYSGTKTFYADLMFGLGGSVNAYYEVQDPNNSRNQAVYNTLLASPLSRFGFRIGTESMRISSDGANIGARLNFEIGFRPYMAIKSPYNGNGITPFFFSLKVGLNKIADF